MSQDLNKNKITEQAIEHIAWLFLELIDEKNKKAGRKVKEISKSNKNESRRKV